MIKMSLFSYLKNENQREIRKSIVGYLLYGSALYQGKRLLTLQEINEINRDELAEKFYYDSQQRIESIRQMCDDGLINRSKLLDEIAMYIDLKLPSAWMRKKAFKENKTRLIYKGIETVPGAVFKCSENYDIDKLIVREVYVSNNRERESKQEEINQPANNIRHHMNIPTISQLMNEQGLTYEELAEKSGVNNHVIHRIEQKRFKRVLASDVLKLSAALNSMFEMESLDE